VGYSEVYNVLGQLNPAATTLTDLLTVAAGKKMVVSSIVICNLGIAGTFRISIAEAGAANDPKQYIYYDLDIPISDTFIATIGITLTATDVIRIYASHANMAFNVFGTELTVT